MAYEEDNNNLMMIQSIKLAINHSDDITHISFSNAFKINREISNSSIFYCELGNITFTNCVFYGLFLENTFSGCRFFNCTFYNNFTRCKIFNCKFINCTFNGSRADEEDDNISDNKSGINDSVINDSMFNTCSFINYKLDTKDGKTSCLFGKNTKLININFVSCGLPAYDELYVTTKFNDNYMHGRDGHALFHYYFFFNDRIILNPAADLIRLDDYLENKEYLPNELPVELINRLSYPYGASVSIEFKEKLCKLIHKMYNIQAKNILNTLGNK